MERMSHNRLDRQEIKHDEFVSGVTRTVIWIEDNARKVLWGLGAVVLLIVAGFALTTWMSARNERAMALLAEVERRYHAAVQGEQEPVLQRQTPGGAYASREEKYRAVLEAADDLLARHGSGNAARQARYYRGLALRDLGRLDEAAGEFEKIVNGRSKPLSRALAQVALAGTREAAGRWGEAAGIYDVLAQEAPEPFPREMALVGKARCLEMEQKLDEARALYRKVIDAYPDSPYAETAQERLKQIG
jgi:tetratricopeptide (TPR) repeat protein